MNISEEICNEVGLHGVDFTKDDNFKKLIFLKISKDISVYGYCGLDIFVSKQKKLERILYILKHVEYPRVQLMTRQIAKQKWST